MWGLPLINARQRGTGGVKSCGHGWGLSKAALGLHSLFLAQGVVLLHLLQLQKPLGAQCLLAVTLGLHWGSLLYKYGKRPFFFFYDTITMYS